VCAVGFATPIKECDHRRCDHADALPRLACATSRASSWLSLTLARRHLVQYLINPEGKFVTFYGKNFTAAQIAESLSGHIAKWKASHPDYKGAHKL
jgi:hypothetical protein